VSAVLRLCNEASQPVITHGGLTGLVDGAQTTEGDLVLSLERMNTIEDLDETAPALTVQAGVTLQAMQQRAEAAGFFFPVDLGARGSATAGGIISTNAGGTRVIRWGMTRQQVLGLEAVLADGTIVSSLYPIVKNNSGYDLKHLFIGSEGTLGVVTRAILRLQPQARNQNTAFVAVNEFSQLTQVLRHMSATLGGTLSAFEALWNDFYRLVTTPPALSRPVLPQTYPYYAIVDALGADPQRDRERFTEALEQLADSGVVADCVVAMSAAERSAIWAPRDDVDQLHRFGRWFGFDVSLPIRHMETYVAEVRTALDARFPGNHCFVFGHMGDGNLHLNIYPGPDPDSARRAVEEIVYSPLTSRSGSVSGEHGIGLEKRPYLKLCRKPAEIEMMRTLKRALDPKGILNPGKVLE
jgi:FAD/FMN-containing dehydrogenase